MDRIYRISQFGARVNRSTAPLRALDCSGPFPAWRTVTDPRYDTAADALGFLGPDTEGTTVVYARRVRFGGDKCEPAQGARMD